MATMTGAVAAIPVSGLRAELQSRFTGQSAKEILRYIMYSAGTVGAASATLAAPAKTTFFTTGYANATNGYMDTNWPGTTAALPGNNAFVIKAIQFQLPATVTTVAAQGILIDSKLTLSINQRSYFEAPLVNLPSGGGINGYDSTASTPNLNNGEPNANNAWKFGGFNEQNSGLILFPQTVFEVAVISSYTTGTTRCYVKMVGEFYRDA